MEQAGLNYQNLPESGELVLDWTWQDYAPYYAELKQRKFVEDTCGQWLSDWTRINALLQEQGTRLHLISAADTRSAANRDALQAWQSNLMPRAVEAEQQLKTRLLESGIVPPTMEVPLRNLRAEAERFCEANLELLVQQSKLCNEYSQLTGSMTVDWEGQEITTAELRPVLLDRDRTRREAAWRLLAQRYASESSPLDRIWSELIRLRQQMAENAGCKDLADYLWPLKHRFDYQPADCQVFHESVRTTVTPVLAARHRRLRTNLGLECVRPWDLLADQHGRQAMRPFSSSSEMEAECSRILHLLDADLGQQFDLLRDGLMDLPNRPGKAPGGWCSVLSAVQRPFIYMNAVGLHNDLQTLLHEAGHAFHTLAVLKLPWWQQRDCPMEFSEVASMAMELLAAPYFSRAVGGCYSPEDASRARLDHLDNMLSIWTMVAVGDAFQHWVYSNPGESSDSAACSKVYLSLWRSFHPEVDLSGIEDEVASRWRMTLHFYLVPFYYIEYGIAQLGAVQVWRNARRDKEAALNSYKAALALGGTASLPELFETAGARFGFDQQLFQTCVDELEALRAELEEETALVQSA